MKHPIPTLLLVIPAAAVLPTAARAQMLDAKVISLDAAKTIAAASEAEARKRGWTVAIAVVDVSGGLILFHRFDEVQAASLDLAIAKARTSARFKRPTKALSDAIAAGRLALLAADGYLPLEGGVPVIVGGKVVGAVGVSGVTSEQDAVVAQAGADAIR
ncbi:heme-binding protein [soil metagenome]